MTGGAASSPCTRCLRGGHRNCCASRDRAARVPVFRRGTRSPAGHQGGVCLRSGSAWHRIGRGRQGEGQGTRVVSSARVARRCTPGAIGDAQAQPRGAAPRSARVSSGRVS
ncbi:Hypothetical protein CAP_5792 [Chondromyces apiculatus DSM 436]|uniref:Uncharacterized protein n=1 Tax=Chondromyces apiculatus DSM 436 TaxID=1192034 RepID=A0A017T219_9BACT|nr:Hypothetical protein CAP_5792 [Chondromyces apiculatus DSM 436]